MYSYFEAKHELQGGFDKYTHFMVLKQKKKYQKKCIPCTPCFSILKVVVGAFYFTRTCYPDGLCALFAYILSFWLFPIRITFPCNLYLIIPTEI